jgi:hypothetical protein
MLHRDKESSSLDDAIILLTVAPPQMAASSTAPILIIKSLGIQKLEYLLRKEKRMAHATNFLPQIHLQRIAAGSSRDRFCFSM